jgi:hypothetical protein
VRGPCSTVGGVEAHQRAAYPPCGAPLGGSWATSSPGTERMAGGTCPHRTDKDSHHPHRLTLVSSRDQVLPGGGLRRRRSGLIRLGLDGKICLALDGRICRPGASGTAWPASPAPHDEAPGALRDGGGRGVVLHAADHDILV